MDIVQESGVRNQESAGLRNQKVRVKLSDVPHRLLLTLAAAMLAAVASAQQTDLDTFMARVIERRDDNWKKLQQYVLEERETFQITGPGGQPLFGSEREYAWFPRDGVFVKSPLRLNGVTISERDRRAFEE